MEGESRGQVNSETASAALQRVLITPQLWRSPQAFAEAVEVQQLPGHHRLFGDFLANVTFHSS